MVYCTSNAPHVTFLPTPPVYPFIPRRPPRGSIRARHIHCRFLITQGLKNMPENCTPDRKYGRQSKTAHTKVLRKSWEAQRFSICGSPQSVGQFPASLLRTFAPCCKWLPLELKCRSQSKLGLQRRLQLW